MAPESKEQTFSIDTVAALVAAIIEKGGTVGMKEYELMASLDPTRSASAFEHQFRKVKARAKELLDSKGGDGALNTPKKKGTKKGKETPTSTGKRVRKGKKSEEEELDEDDFDVDESPAKKVKAEPLEDGFGSDGEEDGGAKV